MNIKVIDKFEDVTELKFDEIAFPKINYTQNSKLYLKNTTLLAAYAIISQRVDQEFIQEIQWNNNGDICWQNDILEYLSITIFKMISEYQKSKSDFMLTKIFIWIQLWGGNSGRSVFVKGQGWPENFDIKIYRKGIKLTQKGKYEEALCVLNTLYGVKTAFSTKHIYFWSMAKAPIYDSIIAAIIFGRNKKQIRAQEYPKYIEALKKMKSEINFAEVNESSIERNLFNWADSDNGVRWRGIRLNSV